MAQNAAKEPSDEEWVEVASDGSSTVEMVASSEDAQAQAAGGTELTSSLEDADEKEGAESTLVPEGFGAMSIGPECTFEYSAGDHELGTSELEPEDGAETELEDEEERDLGAAIEEPGAPGLEGSFSSICNFPQGGEEVEETEGAEEAEEAEGGVGLEGGHEVDEAEGYRCGEEAESPRDAEGAERAQGSEGRDRREGHGADGQWADGAQAQRQIGQDEGLGDEGAKGSKNEASLGFGSRAATLWPFGPRVPTEPAVSQREARGDESSPEHSTPSQSRNCDRAPSYSSTFSPKESGLSPSAPPEGADPAEGEEEQSESPVSYDCNEYILGSEDFPMFASIESFWRRILDTVPAGPNP
mmetsp:Transcript_26601/g.41623  ORF Transcript_26601/g.41623 Transcript_26601/m.41623 type:complete len:357 (-) Transcript_26601:1275-2345(-)